MTDLCPKLKTRDVMLAVADYFDPRHNLMVPNVHWGFGVHECDLFILTPSNYAWEVEIKVDRHDLKNDAKKRHGHNNEKISRLWFAIPDYLLDEIEYIPARAGILSIYRGKNRAFHVKKIRHAERTGAYRLSQDERYMIARLGALRIWGLIKKIA